MYKRAAYMEYKFCSVKLLRLVGLELALQITSY